MLYLESLSASEQKDQALAIFQLQSVNELNRAKMGKIEEIKEENEKIAAICKYYKKEID